jgi:hypothetical protein
MRRRNYSLCIVLRAESRFAESAKKIGYSPRQQTRWVYI